jgi:Tol biopolymer transport system component
MRRWTILVAIPFMVAFGFGVYYELGTMKSRPAAPAKPVTKARTLVPLPGTIYLSQGGVLYKLQTGQFTAIHPGPGAWSQPARAPDGGLVAVSRQTHFSDLYLLDGGGHATRQLTNNASGAVEFNHWAFYPNVTPDGKTLLFSYDPKDPYNNFRVDLAVWSMPLGGRQSDGRRRTTPNPFTGGDVQPLALPSGAVIYAKYGIDDAGQSLSQLWLQSRPGVAGLALTDAKDDCSSPALSPDGSRVAMMCTGGKQTARLEVASFDGQKLGPREVLVDGQLASVPSWSPDGRSLVYLAPGGVQTRFQLWYVQLEAPAATPSPSKPAASGPATPAPALRQPRLVTNDLDLDATSAPLWVA